MPFQVPVEAKPDENSTTANIAHQMCHFARENGLLMHHYGNRIQMVTVSSH